MGKIAVTYGTSLPYNITKVTHGATEIISVYEGTNLIMAGILEFDPDYDIFVEGAPYTTQEYDCSSGGDIYLTGISSGYIEVDWYKNSSYQGYLYVYDGGANYPNGRTFAIADGDAIKFRFAGETVSGSLVFKADDASGNTVLTISWEMA